MKHAPPDRPVIAVCGKGGVGKTAFSALLARALLEAGVRPLLLVDADPVGGLTSAIGERPPETLAGVRDRVILAAREGGRAGAEEAADHLDFFILQALAEREDHALLAMGRNAGKGCFCPANKLLRGAMDKLIGSFAAALIDAEAGIEQISRDVTGQVNQVVVVVDASRRSLDTLHVIAGMVGSAQIAVVANRAPAEGVAVTLPDGVALLGTVPEDEELRRFDREGRPLWGLPSDNAALQAVRAIAARL